MTVSTDTALSVDDLRLEYRIGTEWKEAIRGVSFDIPRGKTFGLVGESGCGKSTIAMALMHYLPRNGRITGGTIRMGGRDITQLSGRELRDLRVHRLSMVYQDPMTALNPSIRIGRQVAEVFELLDVESGSVRDRVKAVLQQVKIADPESVMRRYPHQLSGGMLQRVVIAMAIASEPELLILDEPTTGLDATVEAEVLDLVSGLRDEVGTSVLFISHSLAVIRKMCDVTGVLYAGRMVAYGPTDQIFHDPRHPYTVGLLRCLPGATGGEGRQTLDTIPGFLPPLGADLAGCVYVDRCVIAEDICHVEEPELLEVGPGRYSRCHFHERAPDLPRTEPPVSTALTPGDVLLSIRGASKTFHQDGKPVHALVDVDLDIKQGETLALVGESGSGKSTLAKIILGILVPDEGTLITLGGQIVPPAIEDRDDEQFHALQMVFQNPDSALNRRHSIRRIIGRAVEILRPGADVKVRVDELMASVRVGTQLLSVKPRHLSGGLKQRVAIARAFAGSPRVVVCDEPTSALDVSVQAAILNLLAELQHDERVSYLFISHDLSVVQYVADRVAVLYLGRIMEVGTSRRIFGGPHHPYTEALLSASPDLDEDRRIRLEGEIPSASDPPPGCVFQTRCHRKIGEICETVEPQLVEVEDGYGIRCHIPVDELARLQAT
ncbi:MAG TPA: ABC transporter ATP-binding protein [Acidimicrobiia bacterium]|nr:ABC transporter ATP-binding protein [Acidimicrobiia bacterium]